MIDTELKNRLIGIYKDIYKNTLDTNYSRWEDFTRGELIGATKVLTELGMADDMDKAWLDICANIEE